MTTSTYFKDIKKQLKLQLAYAQKSVYVAVAWFTDRELFSILCELAKKNISVYLLVSDDEHNYRLDFEELTDLGGNFYRISVADKGKMAIMHHKFCVIDEKTTITGSYNWTNNAQRNHESILIIENQPEVALDYITEFHDLTQLNSYSVIINRANVLKRYLSEKDKERIEKSLEKFLEKVEDTDFIQKLSVFIEQEAYERGITCIIEFLQKNSQLVVYYDPKIPLLKLEIKKLEYEIKFLLEEKGRLSQLIYQFNILYYQRLGGIIEELLRLKAKKNKIYEQEYAQFQESFEEAQGVEIAVLEETEKKELKSLYNKGVQLCHPDKYTSEEEKKLAHDWFVALNDANQKNDLVRVREILNNLETGNFLHRKIKIYTNVEELEKQLEYLEEEREKLNQEIQTLCQDIPLSIIENEALWDNYFENQETLLKTQLAQYQ